MIEAFLITVTLSFQGGNTTLDINANIALQTTLINRCGTSFIPHVTTINPGNNCFEYYGKDAIIRHEWIHHDQWSALGPAFLPSYWLTAGRAFEDYWDMMWIPPPGMEDNCPLLRVGESVEFMPCYRF